MAIDFDMEVVNVPPLPKKATKNPPNLAKKTLNVQ